MKKVFIQVYRPIKGLAFVHIGIIWEYYTINVGH